MSGKMRRVAVVLIAVLCVVLLSAQVFASEAFSIVTLEQSGANHVYLEWNAYPNADGYSLYRSGENGAFTLVKHIASCSTFNYGLENGKSYTYLVRPYKVQSCGGKQYLDESEHVSIQIGVKRPEAVLASPYGKTSAVISWAGDPLADYYNLYRSTDGTEWSLVKRVYAQTTITYGLEEEKTYFFRVKAARQVNGVVRFSDHSDIAECTLGISAPEYLNLKRAGTSYVELEWKPVPGATGYRLYRAEGGGAYELVKTVVGTGTKNYNLRSDVIYTYRIAAIMQTDICTFKSNYTYAQPIRLSLEQVENLRTEAWFATGIKLCWDSVEGATAYRLYRTGEDGATRLVKTVPGYQTSTYSLVDGQCYRFLVKPICESGTVTVNGPVSESLPVFFAAGPQVTAQQSAVNRILLSWNAVRGAEKYQVTLSQEGALLLETVVTGTEIECQISAPGEVSILVQAVREDIPSAGAAATLSPVYEPELSFDIAEAISETRISLAWERAEYGLQYEVQRLDAQTGSFTTIAVCDNVGYVDDDVCGDMEYQYRYRVLYNNGDNLFWGKWSETICILTPGAVEYRALLIGEEHYDSVLNGPVNDVEAMTNMLSGLTAMDWETYRQTDATRDEIISLISLAFMDASENDISMFFYSGHGVTGSGEYYSGALVTVDYSYIPMAELAELLSVIPGKVIVVLDSCGSGAAIDDGTNALAEQMGADIESFDPASFNTQVIQEFSRYNATIQDKAGELAAEKFYVLTSSAYEQNSRSICIDNVWGGVFTRSLVGSVGYEYNSRSWNETMIADQNADGELTVRECYEYCFNEASKYQDVQVYPSDSSVTLFYR